jgi:hypothetical protein
MRANLGLEKLRFIIRLALVIVSQGVEPCAPDDRLRKAI